MRKSQVKDALDSFLQIPQGQQQQIYLLKAQQNIVTLNNVRAETGIRQTSQDASFNSNQRGLSSSGHALLQANQSSMPNLQNNIKKPYQKPSILHQVGSDFLEKYDKYAPIADTKKHAHSNSPMGLHPKQIDVAKQQLLPIGTELNYESLSPKENRGGKGNFRDNS